ncbi:alpha/beta-hydrolase [Xylariaceae sp. FL0016]|nr:alpha/beta-hydrolase [Xylariaceae sp. FL0016]
MAPHKTDVSATSRPAPENWLLGTEAFERRMPHHDGIKALWETKWKFPCSKTVYPFHDGAYADFEPIFADLIARDINDGYAAAFTGAFVPTARRLEEEGDDAAARGDRDAASRLYLRAAAVLRIARFPYVAGYPAVTDEAKWAAWELQKSIYMKAASKWACPVSEVHIPHKHASPNDRDQIPAYVRVPTTTTSSSSPCPVVLLLTGLDGYRPDNTVRCEEFLARGWGAVVVEIPGTADCPADSADPGAAERLWDSVLDWMAADGRFDTRRVLCWGLSAGGYYAARLAHTHAGRLAGCVAQGAAAHHFFDAGWLARAEGHEYPFALLPALAMKHGFGDDVEGFVREAQGKFSLVDNGIAEGKSCRLLLVNGTMDGLMPIEDSMILFEYGSPKEARFFSGALHMGYPMANASVYPWMEEVMSSVK